jgi:hypothetical protein
VAEVKSGNKGRLIALILLGIILLAGVAWYVFLRSTPERTAKAFLKAMQQGDARTAKSLISAASDTNGLTEGGMPAEARKIKFEVGKANIKGKTATVPVTITFPKSREAEQFFGRQNPTMTQPLGLVKEGGRWKIDERETDKAMRENMPAMPGR